MLLEDLGMRLACIKYSLIPSPLLFSDVQMKDSEPLQL